MKRNILQVLFVVFGVASMSAQNYKEWVDRSGVAADKKDWLTAEECLLKALRTEPANPQNGMLLSNMGTIQRKQGKNSEALQSYTNGLLFAPKSTTLLLNRAALYLELDSLLAAQRDYSSVLKYDSINQDAIISRGEIEIALNDTLSAKQDFEKALTLAPQNFRATLGLHILKKISGNYKEAEKIINSLILLNPLSHAALFHRAELYYFQKKYTRALEDVNKLIEKSKEDELCFYLRGKIHFSLFERKLAYQDFEKAKALGYHSDELEKWIKKSK